VEAYRGTITLSFACIGIRTARHTVDCWTSVGDVADRVVSMWSGLLDLESGLVPSSEGNKGFLCDGVVEAHYKMSPLYKV